MMRRFISRRGAATTALGSWTTSAQRTATDALTQRKPHPHEQFVAPDNEVYMEALMAQYKAVPTSVDASWWPVLNGLPQASPDVSVVDKAPPVDRTAVRRGGAAGNAVPTAALTNIHDGLKLAWMCQAFELQGHLVADLDPLGIFAADLDKGVPDELLPSFYGFTEADLDGKSFNVAFSPDAPGLVVDGATRMTLREIIAKLHSIYSGKIAFEFAHVPLDAPRNWLRAEIQRTLTAPANHAETLTDVIAAERFEFLLHTKFKTHKRFGLDGGESLIAGLRSMVAEHAQLSGTSHGPAHAVIGMAHRGRLNVLHNLCGKPLENILAEFEGRVPEGHTNNRGDVKYHMGYDGVYRCRRGGADVGIHLAPNPSHLECVNPVMQGICRAMADTARQQGLPGAAKSILPIVIHGDAAFAGQGVCYEHLAMGDLPGYTVEGSIHIVINNQVGFTTNPVQSRSAAYCSDLAKLTSCPVIHVNGDHPDQVVRAFEIAARYRHVFRSDVVVDMVCYRRYGHNEGDQPRFTQPVMYRKIDAHPTVLKVYGEALAKSNVLTREEIQERTAAHDNVLRGYFTTFEESKIWKKKEWSDVVAPFAPPSDAEIAAASKAPALATLPIEDLLGAPKPPFNRHDVVGKVLDKRLNAFVKGSGIEWAAAEQLAFASLLRDGHSIRLSGQDVERGTFAQRHYVVHDAKTNEVRCSLKAYADSLPHKPLFTITNSLLSEFAASAFEFGYSTNRNKDIVMWEGQFGDFANGAQPVWDQFVSACEVKWGQRCNLIISLPHGYDGQGPEHSSSRFERFLQLSDDGDFVPADFPIQHPWAYEHRCRQSNIQVCYPSTPANYFHLLRRQVKRAGDIVKPLVVCFSKQFLRDANPSTVAQLEEGHFQPVIVDPRNITKPRKIVFCTGQLYHVLLTKQPKEDVALVRIEQLAPFPWETIVEALKPYAAANPNAEMLFAQEEPKNMGAYPFVRPRLREALKLAGFTSVGRDLPYVGRPAAASPATGFEFQHKYEVESIVKGVWA